MKSVLHFLNNNKKESKKMAYRKISKISTGAYIFQRPFLRGLFLEVLIFGGPYLRREIDWASLIFGGKFTGFCFVLLCINLGAIFQVQSPGGLYLEGPFNGDFFTLPVWGAYIWRGLYVEGFIFVNLRYLRP